MNQAKKRLMVVDDHGIVRLGLVALLSQQPDLVVVGQASSAEEALPMIAELKPDLVVMDVRLPGRDGIAACRETKAVSPSTEVIVLSSFAEPQTVTAAFMAGARGYVLKDLENHRLLQAIQTVAAGGSALDPNLGVALAQGMQAMMKEKQAPPPEPLSKHDTAILKLVAKGLTNREIGDQLHLSDKTVRNYLSEFMHKHNLHNRAEAAAFAVQQGLLDHVRVGVG
ncbi:MAG TPA: response regulator transcription factor [Symbiobacteriaceae bacterium]|nr:response regulator transcription factor [Symbiobacteriaceae bacterium]